MRKIFLFMNVSLDGYFEAPGHDISGFKADFEFNAFSPGQAGEVDALLFGRRTYEMMRDFWPTPQAAETAPLIARFMNEKRKFVASRNPAYAPGWSNVTVLHEDVPAQVKQLKAQPGETIAMFGSNSLVVSLMPAGLVDEFQIMLNPVAFGAGTPLFQGLPGKADFRLVESRQFSSGNVLLTYVPL